MGWFLGGRFSPTLYEHDDFEVACKFYKKGEKHEPHYHLKSVEYTVFQFGIAKVNGKLFGANTILIVSPGEIIEFEAITDIISVVIKCPSAIGDKYLVDNKSGE